MINLKKYNNLMFIMMIFSLIIFTFSIYISIISAKYKNENEINGLLNNETKYFKFDTSKSITSNNILDVLKEYKNANIYMEYSSVSKVLENDTLFGKAVYYNYKINNKFPILKGRNFTLNDIESSDKLVLVGKNLTNQIIEENNEQYFNIDNENYKVIGILGDKEKETGYDNTFIVNLQAINCFTDYRKKWKINVDNTRYENEILSRYERMAENSQVKFDFIQSNSEKVDIFKIIKNYPEFMNMFIMIVVFGMVNLIIVVYYWMNKSIKEIGIRKAYGATDIEVAFYILKRYQFSVIVSIFVGISLHLIFKTILQLMFPEFYFDIYFKNIIIIALVFMLSG